MITVLVASTAPGTQALMRMAGPASAVSSAAARRARLIRLASERDLGHLPILRTLQLEVLVGAELEEARDEIGRELLDRRIEVAHDGVEVAAGVLDRLLDLPARRPERLE